ncbi:hypothetical protein CEXT_728931 [Caerostris extrusa]|uniref:Period n=1 Tax=Caerostris extrusa TaxID=172846 RepID=A0AAV4PWZ6_CAEEX|nr:hypothetical protein CEXT_728931 [Caerostris extrusa]
MTKSIKPFHHHQVEDIFEKSDFSCIPLDRLETAEQHLEKAPLNLMTKSIKPFHHHQVDDIFEEKSDFSGISLDTKSGGLGASGY